MRIKRQERTSSRIADFLGIFGISREPNAGRRITTGIMTRKGIKVKKRFKRSGREVFEEARRAKK